MIDAVQAPDRRQRELLGRLSLTLPRLDALLRAEGFVVGPDRWQNVYDLLTELQAHGRLPAQAAPLRPLLAPLFCRDAVEQARFAEVFRRWIDELAQQPDAVPERTVTPKKPPPEPPPRPPLRRLIAGLMIGALALALFTYGVVRYVTEPEAPPTERQPPVTKPAPSADAGTAVQPAEPLELQPLPPRTPLEQPNLNAANRAWLRTAGLLMTLLPAFLLAGLLGVRWLSWSLVLRRRPGQEGVPLHAITLDARQDDLFDAPALREALKRLHTPVPVPTRRLDPDATVRASANNAGLFRPMWRQRRLVPDCVVLLDHAHGADQMAGLALQAVERLHQAGLEVVRYDYRRDPRRLMGEDGRWHGLAQVAARHEGSRLLVIGEAASLVNPLSGALYRWTDVIELWPKRGLLSTRLPPQAWRDALNARGFLVADLGSAGLAETAAWFSPVPVETPAAPAPPLRPLPVLLQDDERWLQPVAPPTAERESLLQTLRGYLGKDGLLLFAAMAAYPQLHWGLTRALDLGLYRDQTADRRERRLLTVARLPWCRAGGLPDWLREMLKADLDADDIERIARLYQWLMREAEVNGRGSISLPVSLPESGRFWRGLRRWLRTRGQVADRYDPRNDRVFVEMLLGRRARLLDFRLPRPLARRLGARLNALLPRLVLAALIAAAAGWGMQQTWEGWGRAPVAKRLLAWQLQDHQNVTVDIWHTQATQDYAEALAQTLREARFQVNVEPRELAMAGPLERQAQTAANQTQIQPVNAVQWGAAGDQDAATYLANRLGYLTWGGVPNQVAPGADLPLTGSGLEAPPEPGQVRVLLLTPARDRTGFAFRDFLKDIKDATVDFDFGDYHALVIGNNSYQHLSNLYSAINDAKGVKEVLERKYGFKVRLLTDATRVEILRALEDYLRNLGEKDNLLIYYAGHGFLDQATNQGYWQPVDATPDSRALWIKTGDVTDILDEMLARRVLLVSDSSYSGAFARSITNSADIYARKGTFWIHRMEKKRTRMVLASGGLEPVLDCDPEDPECEHSVFARYFIQTLEDNNQLLTGRELFDQMDLRVRYAAIGLTDQEPVYAPMPTAGHEGGEFFFKPASRQ